MYRTSPRFVRQTCLTWKTLRCFQTAVPHMQQNVKSQTEAVLREQDIPFAQARHGPFTQEAPKLGNQYLEDALLQSYLKRHVPQKVCSENQKTRTFYCCNLCK